MICAHGTSMVSRVENVDTVRYVRLYADATGVSRFEDADFHSHSRARSRVLKVHAGWADPAHPAPARQFMPILSGQIEVETEAVPGLLRISVRTSICRELSKIE